MEAALSAALAFGMVTYIVYYIQRLTAIHAGRGNHEHMADAPAVALIIASIVGVMMLVVGQHSTRVLKNIGVLGFCLVAAHVIVALAVDKVSPAFALSNMAELIVAATLWRLVVLREKGET